MAQNADLLICDSINIEKYMKEEYKKYKKLKDDPRITLIGNL